jgi:hypothetical protein
VIFDPGDQDVTTLYAIFVCEVRETAGGEGPRRQAVLCSSTLGVADWRILSTSVPEGMESSPGVYVNKKLWLIGGSAVDPDRISHRVCCFDPDPNSDSKTWNDVAVDGFPEAQAARMGHACVVVDNETIWMLGRQDEYKCVNDVWILKIKPEGGMTASRMSATWNPRCMFSAFKYNQKIWVFGGVDAPHGKPVGDVWTTPHGKLVGAVWTSTGLPENWVKDEKMVPPDLLKTAIAVGVATPAQSRPWTFFRTEATEASNDYYRMHMLTQATNVQNKWEGGPAGLLLSVHDDWDSWMSDPHSIAMVRFRDLFFFRFLHRNAFYGQTVAAPLFYYVKL